MYINLHVHLKKPRPLRFGGEGAASVAALLNDCWYNGFAVNGREVSLTEAFRICGRRVAPRDCLAEALNALLEARRREDFMTGLIALTEGRDDDKQVNNPLC